MQIEEGEKQHEKRAVVIKKIGWILGVSPAARYQRFLWSKTHAQSMGMPKMGCVFPGHVHNHHRLLGLRKDNCTSELAACVSVSAIFLFGTQTWTKSKRRLNLWPFSLVVHICNWFLSSSYSHCDGEGLIEPCCGKPSHCRGQKRL